MLQNGKSLNLIQRFEIFLQLEIAQKWENSLFARILCCRFLKHHRLFSFWIWSILVILSIKVVNKLDIWRRSFGTKFCPSFTTPKAHVVEDGTWNPGIYFTMTFSLFKMFNREKMFYHPLMSKYAMRHLATGQLPRALSHDIVISW